MYKNRFKFIFRTLRTITITLCCKHCVTKKSCYFFRMSFLYKLTGYLELVSSRIFLYIQSLTYCCCFKFESLYNNSMYTVTVQMFNYKKENLWFLLALIYKRIFIIITIFLALKAPLPLCICSLLKNLQVIPSRSIFGTPSTKRFRFFQFTKKNLYQT